MPLSQKPIRAGLSNKDNVKPLLNTVNHKKRNGGRPAPAEDDPPVDDESGEGGMKPSGDRPEPAVDDPPMEESSDDDVPTKGQVCKTNFLSLEKGNRTQFAGVQSGYRERASSPEASKPYEGRYEESDQTGLNVKKEVSEEDDILGSHLRTDVDWVLRGNKTKPLLHSKNFAARHSTQKTAQESKPQRIPKLEVGSPRPELKLPTGATSRRISESPDRRSTLAVPRKLPLAESPPRKRSKLLERSTGTLHDRRQEPTPEPLPTLKLPTLAPSSLDLAPAEKDDPDADRKSFELSLRRSASPVSDLTSITLSPPICPMCYEEVDRRLLEDFRVNRPRMTLQHQQSFCILHRKRSARAAWLDRGFPDIKWNRLEGRIQRQYGFLRGILEGGKSFYGEMFSQTVKSGRNKELLKAERSLIPGYYGIRGLRTMSENLVGEFSSMLRKRAVLDRLVSARGHIAYVQCVLVPELAVRLIMEDMNVSAEGARLIMKDSIWVGELLNEEVADVIVDDDNDDS